MPNIRYVSRRFSESSQTIIQQANEIIQQYATQGYDLTLRQLYYQFVARDLLPNTVQSYKRLGSIVNDGRMAGLIDWDRLVDRTRGLESLATWHGPQDIVDACSRQFRHDIWRTQEYRPEVWIEKEALAGVFEGVCNELRIPYLSCRGYVSQSEMWRAGQRLRDIFRKGSQTPIILHFGDHDPSGIDMTRDIKERLHLFATRPVEIRRLALNMAQIEEYNPPPNPAKENDARFTDYESIYGNQSWELDALEPALLTQLVVDEVATLRDQEAWDAAVEEEAEARRLLGEVAGRWDDLTEGL